MQLGGLISIEPIPPTSSSFQASCSGEDNPVRNFYYRKTSMEFSGMCRDQILLSLWVCFMLRLEKSNTVPDKSQMSGHSAPAAFALPHSQAGTQKDLCVSALFWPVLQPWFVECWCQRGLLCRWCALLTCFPTAEAVNVSLWHSLDYFTMTITRLWNQYTDTPRKSKAK